MTRLPQHVEIHAESHVLREELKDGFWSSVGVYEGPVGRVVLKVHREEGWRGLPLRWIGRMMARREVLLLGKVQGVEGVPLLYGAWGATGLIHEYLPGHVLRHKEPMPVLFFERLERLVLDVHARGVACADLSRRDNILVREDGAPCLFDFQIGWCWPPAGASRLTRLLPGWIGLRVLAILQDADLHHVLKHRARHVQGDPVVAAARERLARPAWPIRFLRVVSKPYRVARAWLLARRRNPDTSRNDGHDS